MAAVNCQRITGDNQSAVAHYSQIHSSIKLTFNGPKSKTNINNKSLRFLANFTHHQI